jgi:hypothetical protein
MLSNKGISSRIVDFCQAVRTNSLISSSLVPHQLSQPLVYHSLFLLSTDPAKDKVLLVLQRLIAAWTSLMLDPPLDQTLGVHHVATGSHEECGVFETD